MEGVETIRDFCKYDWNLQAKRDEVSLTAHHDPTPRANKQERIEYKNILAHFAKKVKLFDLS